MKLNRQVDYQFNSNLINQQPKENDFQKFIFYDILLHLYYRKNSNAYASLQNL